ncbi:MAG: metal-binding protein [Timaviella obliquedivisa GSE-PSE-MK23-08B]|nr:metal-binding protein [Timaviella obliquedivisa GSE-PSE-MK23-08B]
MPSGQTHDRITLWTLPMVAGLTLAVTRNSLPTLMICAGYLFGGLMLGPDLDLHSIHYKRWGWFRWIWLPYRGSMKHRSPYSHAPIMGTTLRVIYLLAWLGLAGFLGIALSNELFQIGWTWAAIGQGIGQFLQRYLAEAIALCIGLELGAFSHYTADWLVSSHKRRKKKK